LDILSSFNLIRPSFSRREMGEKKGASFAGFNPIWCWSATYGGERKGKRHGEERKGDGGSVPLLVVVSFAFNARLQEEERERRDRQHHTSYGRCVVRLASDAREEEKGGKEKKKKRNIGRKRA